MTLTFLDTAGAMADVDGLPGKLMPTLLRRLRAFDSKGLVPVQREDAGRREGRLDVTGACMARIHSELTDFGFDAETLRGLRSYLDMPAVAESPESHFAVAVEAVRAGAAVTLAAELRQVRNPWRKWHKFRLSGHMPDNARVAEAVALLDAAEGVEVRAVLTLDLTELLGNFIRAFEAADLLEG